MIKSPGTGKKTGRRQQNPPRSSRNQTRRRKSRPDGEEKNQRLRRRPRLRDFQRQKARSGGSGREEGASRPRGTEGTGKKVWKSPPPPQAEVGRNCSGSRRSPGNRGRCGGKGVEKPEKICYTAKMAGRAASPEDQMKAYRKYMYVGRRFWASCFTFFICTGRPLIWSIPIISASPSPICRTCGTRKSFSFRIFSPGSR